MASNAFAGVGTTFQRWDGHDWQIIAEVRAITGPSANKGVIDVTSLDTEEGSREYISGFKQGGEVNLALTFTRDTYELMKEDFEAQYEEDYAIVFDDIDNCFVEFLGLVSKLPLEITSDDAIKANVTMVVTGPIEFGTGEVSAGISEPIEYVLDELGNVMMDELEEALIEEM